VIEIVGEREVKKEASQEVRWNGNYTADWEKWQSFTFRIESGIQLTKSASPVASALDADCPGREQHLSGCSAMLNHSSMIQDKKTP